MIFLFYYYYNRNLNEWLKMFIEKFDMSSWDCPESSEVECEKSETKTDATEMTGVKWDITENEMQLKWDITENDRRETRQLKMRRN